MDELNELLQFLTTSTRNDIKLETSKTVAQLTGSEEGLKAILSKGHEFGTALVNFIKDKDWNILENILKTLVNISAEKEGCELILRLESDIIPILLECIYEPEYPYADLTCAILANLSHPLSQCSRVLERIVKIPLQLDNIVSVFCQTKFNKKGETLDLLGSVIENLTQISEGRKLLLQEDAQLFQRLLPFMNYSESNVRRKSIVAAIHNCCFEKDFHKWMLSEEVDLGSHLALPLAGPDSFSTEENDSLPLDLQYLPDDKKREDDPEIRILLLESFMQLCTTRTARQILRDSNIYLILREHHKWEQNEKCIELNEDVVNFFIRTEEEIGAEDLSKLEVPPDLIEKFTESDAIEIEKNSCVK